MIELIVKINWVNRRMFIEKRRWKGTLNGRWMIHHSGPIHHQELYPSELSTVSLFNSIINLSYFGKNRDVSLFCFLYLFSEGLSIQSINTFWFVIQLKIATEVWDKQEN